MKLKDMIIAGLVIFIGVYILFFTPDPEPQEPIITTVTEIDTVFTEVLKEVPKYVPKYIDRVVRDTVEMPLDVDTLAIIEDYFARYIYSDTLKVDSLGFGYITDTVTENKIVERSVVWDYRIPSIRETITTTIQLPPKRKREFYIGLMAGGTQTDFSYFGPSIGFKTKSSKMLTATYGVVGADKVGVSIGLYSKLF
jgi:hypothetical protein